MIRFFKGWIWGIIAIGLTIVLVEALIKRFS